MTTAAVAIAGHHCSQWLAAVVTSLDQEEPGIAEIIGTREALYWECQGIGKASVTFNVLHRSGHILCLSTGDVLPPQPKIRQIS